VIRRTLLTVCLMCAWTRPALADTHGMFPIERVAEIFEHDKTPVRGVFYAIGPGWEPKPWIVLQGEIGYGWGTHDSALFATTSLWHLSLAARGRHHTGGEGDDLDLAVLFGRSSFSLGSAGIAGGIDMRLTNGTRAGPLAKVRIGYGPVVLFLHGGALFGDGVKGVFGLGIEWVGSPSK
jgi:hypothetical protein